MNRCTRQNRFVLLSLRCLMVIGCLSILLCMPIGCKSPQSDKAIVVQEPVKLGIDVLLEEEIHLIDQKRIAVITNQTGLTNTLQSTIDVLDRHPATQLCALFSPEHGFRGERPAGTEVLNSRDEKTGLPIFSLYGAIKKPTKEMLEGIDVVIFDIQDTGLRPYTYIYTMAYAMQAAKEFDKSFIVLDRPNPLGGSLVEGPILEPQFSSFIGLYPIAYVHGMTIGELARFFNQEFGINCDLQVVPMRHWKREMVFDDTGLLWTPPSPHVPESKTPFYQACTGAIGELGTVHIGVGYTLPFHTAAAEWMNGEELSARLNALHLPGVCFRSAVYSPFYGGFVGKTLRGVQLYIIDEAEVRPVSTQIAILHTLHRLYPDHDLFAPDRLEMFRYAMGTDRIDLTIRNGDDLQTAQAATMHMLPEFKAKREKFLLY